MDMGIYVRCDCVGNVLVFIGLTAWLYSFGAPKI